MKRQTLVLVVIGLVLFIAGGAIAYGTVVTGTKHQSPTVTAAVNSPVVVATADIPAGTSGQYMVSQGLVSIQLIPQKKYVATDITTLQGLTDEVLSSSVTKGEAIRATTLTPSTTVISLPKGMDAVTIEASGVAGLAGYLQPGGHVDVYADVSKLSQIPGSADPVPAGLAIPCTELLMTDIEVLDVSTVVPTLAPHANTATRAVPASVTILLAVNPSQARLITFETASESLAVAQTQTGTTPPAVGVCIGTGQTAIPS